MEQSISRKYFRDEQSNSPWGCARECMRACKAYRACSSNRAWWSRYLCSSGHLPFITSLSTLATPPPSVPEHKHTVQKHRFIENPHTLKKNNPVKSEWIDYSGFSSYENKLSLPVTALLQTVVISARINLGSLEYGSPTFASIQSNTFSLLSLCLMISLSNSCWITSIPSRLASGDLGSSQPTVNSTFCSVD